MFRRVFNYWTRQPEPEPEHDHEHEHDYDQPTFDVDYDIAIDMSPSQKVPTSSPLSSPDSYITATALSPTPLDVTTTTDFSSPITETTPESLSFRRARQLPRELKDHCQIYLEENLHLIALHLLNGLLSSRRNRSQDPVYCPPPSLLSLLSTLTIHPDFTTRAKDDTWAAVAVETLVYLRTLLSLAGPINGHYKESTAFNNDSRWSRNHSPALSSGHDDQDDDSDRGQLMGKYNRTGIWRRGQDFFSVVGWAFNCSVLYPNRWRYWKQWLEFMLDLLDADIKERHRLDQESGKEEMTMLRDSILAGYIGQRSGRGAGGVKLIMKAIFADGSKSPTSQFQEIWTKEHKGISKSSLKKRKRETVDIDKGNFGGWLDDDSAYSSQESQPPTPQKRRTNSGLGNPDFQALETAYTESIPLRQRLFSMLSYLCVYIPDPPLDLYDLYDNFESTTKSLPLPIFTAFTSSSTSALRVDSQISILNGILSRFMPSSAISPARVDRATHDSHGVSPAIMERCYLPNPANTIVVEDNAKVSVLLEQLMQIILRDGGEQFSDDLLPAVEKGIQAREAKIKKKKTSARGRALTEDADAEAKAVLEMSGQRLLVLATLAGGSSGHEQEEEVDAMDEDGDEDQVEASFMTAVDDMEQLEAGNDDENELEQSKDDKDEDEDEDGPGRKHCLCQQASSGTMIACDSPACPYVWFHLRCVGLTSAPRASAHWLCPECRGDQGVKKKLRPRRTK
ncbi:hypothetical protein F4778DRAFT_734687 [Xylariomycetidae sp. FL2044]|nr:hypothetical protein F4778DRAFT_734687 [Xylariomycetidae sp. FL2044]